ncbi:hypothetical protein SCHPADRAFT_515334 [Schizopora paradoxa]|uniref:Uncharacterized protein n=1 Tax=Schizopora paradoxa TaxID=27342 RepID=A0A0H2RG39_9AGAM|nr:hypothetical protein SCHPADRAFT_515334 [Schizopora paradoxa]
MTRDDKMKKSSSSSGRVPRCPRPTSLKLEQPCRWRRRARIDDELRMRMADNERKGKGALMKVDWMRLDGWMSVGCHRWRMFWSTIRCAVVFLPFFLASDYIHLCFSMSNLDAKNGSDLLPDTFDLTPTSNGGSKVELSSQDLMPRLLRVVSSFKHPESMISKTFELHEDLLQRDAIEGIKRDEKMMKTKLSSSSRHVARRRNRTAVLWIMNTSRRLRTDNVLLADSLDDVRRRGRAMEREQDGVGVSRRFASPNQNRDKR